MNAEVMPHKTVCHPIVVRGVAVNIPSERQERLVNFFEGLAIVYGKDVVSAISHDDVFVIRRNACRVNAVEHTPPCDLKRLQDVMRVAGKSLSGECAEQGMQLIAYAESASRPLRDARQKAALGKSI